MPSSFHKCALWHVETPTAVDDFVWNDLEAYGRTDLGAAIRLLSLELTPEKMGRRALPPVIVLLSDGTPTDDWEKLWRVLMVPVGDTLDEQSVYSSILGVILTRKH